MQAITGHLRRFKRAKRGISTVIVVMLSLVILVIVVGNIVLWSYQMNQIDWERNQEKIDLQGVTSLPQIWMQHPSAQYLLGSTTLVSGSTSDLAADDGAYTTFRSHMAATTLYVHQEQSLLGETNYYLLKNTTSDASGTSLSQSAASVGRHLMGKFVYFLTGYTSIPASVWNITYRAYTDSPSVVANCAIDISIVLSNGTTRDSIISSDVAKSADIGTSYQTYSATYSWSAYTVVNSTDYLEIDYYIDVTVAKNNKNVYLGIDDNKLPLPDQTSVSNISLNNQYRSVVEFSGLGNTEIWNQLNWTINSAWTASSVNVTIQLYNFTASAYQTSGFGYLTYTSSSTAGTDENATQATSILGTDFRNATGEWKIKVTGVKSGAQQFDMLVDIVEFDEAKNGTILTVQNNGSLTSHIVAVWITNATIHQRYDADLFLNSGETITYARADVALPQGVYVAKVVTERGNIAILPAG